MDKSTKDWDAEYQYNLQSIPDCFGVNKGASTHEMLNTQCEVFQVNGRPFTQTVFLNFRTCLL